MKVVMLGCLPPQRGISSYNLELSKALSEKIEVNFISFKKMYPSFLYPGGDLEEDNTFPNFENKNLKVRRNLTYYNPFTWIREGLVKGDLLHVQWWSYPLAPVYLTIMVLFKLRRKKIIMTVHNVVPHEPNYLLNLLHKIIYLLPNRFILHSDKNIKQMEMCFDINRNKLIKIPHGILGFFKDKEVSKLQARKKLGLNKKDKVILNFGAVREYKGVYTLLKAFSKVIEKNKNAKLIIAGKLWVDWKPYEEFIKKNRLEKGIKLFLDYIPTNQVKYYFYSADLVVLPYKEFPSQSGVGMLALPFSKPLLVSNVGGLPELVKDRRSILEPENNEKWAEEILFRLNNKNVLKKMSKESIELSHQFSWDAISKETIGVYNGQI